MRKGDGTAYVALLRGINVGGHRKVPMADLRALAVDLGLESVSTYIASGNLLFRSSQTADELTGVLHAAMETRFGFTVDVVVVGARDLGDALRGNPFADSDPKQTVITFLSEPYAADVRDKLRELAADGERIEFGERNARWLYVDFAGGLARSKLAAKLHSVSRRGYATTRNIRTVRTIAERLTL